MSFKSGEVDITEAFMLAIVPLVGILPRKIPMAYWSTVSEGVHNVVSSSIEVYVLHYHFIRLLVLLLVVASWAVPVLLVAGPVTTVFLRVVIVMGAVPTGSLSSELRLLEV